MTYIQLYLEPCTVPVPDKVSDWLIKRARLREDEIDYLTPEQLGELKEAVNKIDPDGEWLPEN